MPIIKSAKKRVRVAKKATTRNVKTKRSLKAALKNFQSALSGGNKLNEAHAKAQSALGKAAKKNVIHKNKLARKQRQLSAKAKAAGFKPTSQAQTKPAVKKATVKKTAPAKKPTAKKKS